MSVHPRTAELTDYLARTRATLLAAVRTVPRDVARRRPSPDAWSVAEIVDHVRIVEASVARMLGRMLDRADALEPAADTSSVLGSLDRFALLERRNPITSPEQVRPGPDPDLDEALRGLAQSRCDLDAVLRRADGLAVDGLLAPHPLLGPLSFNQWILFVAQHEARHTTQLLETAARAG
jgi:DinB family protein